MCVCACVRARVSRASAHESAAMRSVGRSVGRPFIIPYGFSEKYRHALDRPTDQASSRRTTIRLRALLASSCKVASQTAQYVSDCRTERSSTRSVPFRPFVLSGYAFVRVYMCVCVLVRVCVCERSNCECGTLAHDHLFLTWTNCWISSRCASV